MTEEIDQEIKRLECCIKLFSNFINHLLFWIPHNGFEAYHFFEKQYHILYNQYSQKIRIGMTERELEHYLISFKQERLNLVRYLKILLDNTLETLDHDQIEIVEKFHQLKQALLNDDLVTTLINDTFSDVINIINRIKTEQLQSFRLNQLSQFSEESKQIQCEIYAIEKSFKDFALLQRNGELQCTPPFSMRDKEGYTDLLLLRSILDSNSVTNALRQKLHWMKIKRDELVKKIVLLQSGLQDSFEEAIRLQRMITVFQQWEEEVLDTVLDKGRVPQNLATAIETQNLLTYVKKAFLCQRFSKQPPYCIIHHLHSFIIRSLIEQKERSGQKECSSQKILEFLLQFKLRLLTRIQQKESKIQKQQFPSHLLLATLLLGIKQHPEYQMGRLATEFSDDLFNRSCLPILSEQLPDILRERLGYAVGCCFLGISLLFSHKIGYSYHLISTMNRIPTSQINLLFQIGSLLESLSQRALIPTLNAIQSLTPTQFNGWINQMKEYSRWDELGVIEKEKWIQWISGLGIILMISGGDILPVTLGYIIATSCREMAGYGMEKLVGITGLSPQARNFAKIMAHLLAYSYAFPYGYRLGRYFRPIHKEEVLSYADALKRFGLHSSVNEKAIKERYKQLALKYHPDKCPTCNGTEMQEINKAYAVLIKKQQ